MNILDNLEEIKRLDKSNLLGSVQQLGLQLKQTNKDLDGLKAPSAYLDVLNIVVNGMGGSRLGARVCQRLFEDTLKIPIYTIGSYTLPAFVNEKTLLILSSYSGNTEEILNTVAESIKRKAKLLVLAQRGKLAQLAKDKKIPGYYNFKTDYNPCNQPRMAIGYQILAIILFLVKCQLLKLEEAQIEELINFVFKVKSRYDVNLFIEDNPAKKTSQLVQGKIPVLVAAEHLMGSLHVWRNQINENSKQIAFNFEIPELNHHLLEGMQFPKNNPQNLIFIFVKSKLYHNRNQKRIVITKKVLDGYKIKHAEISLNGQTKLQQVFELIQFGSFVSFYLAILNKLDPTPIPWVDYFKNELNKI